MSDHGGSMTSNSGDEESVSRFSGRLAKDPACVYYSLVCGA